MLILHAQQRILLKRYLNMSSRSRLLRGGNRIVFLEESMRGQGLFRLYLKVLDPTLKPVDFSL
jgi:hypothetical protein